jgi:hypothetical protein
MTSSYHHTQFFSVEMEFSHIPPPQTGLEPFFFPSQFPAYLAMTGAYYGVKLFIGMGSH